MICKQIRPKAVIWAYWAEVLNIEEQAIRINPIYLTLAVKDHSQDFLWSCAFVGIGIVAVFGLDYVAGWFR